MKYHIETKVIGAEEYVVSIGSVLDDGEYGPRDFRYYPDMGGEKLVDQYGNLQLTIDKRGEVEKRLQPVSTEQLAVEAERKKESVLRHDFSIAAELSILRNHAIGIPDARWAKYVKTVRLFEGVEAASGAAATTGAATTQGVKNGT